MSRMIRATILGCGSSGGVPRIGGRWGDCDPTNPRNRRRRCSMLIDRPGPNGATSVLIDTGPDFVQQLLDAEVSRLDAVIYTHPHADHIHGIDDLRQIVLNTGEQVPVWADASTQAQLLTRFRYIFETPEGSSYPAVAVMNEIQGSFEVEGPAGTLAITPIPVAHGRINALGFRLTAGGGDGGGDSDGDGGLVYLPDVSTIPDTSWPLIEGCDTFVCDALQRTPHSSHAHFAQTMEWMARVAPRRGILTNMHLDMDYDAVNSETPDHISAAYDGMVIEVGA